MAQTYVNSEKAISGGDKEDKTQMLANDQQRRAAVLAEKALNRQMGHFTEKLEDLTKVLDLAANRSYDWMEYHEDAIKTSVSAGIWLKEVWPTIAGSLAAATSDSSATSLSLETEIAEDNMGVATTEYNELMAQNLPTGILHPLNTMKVADAKAKMTKAQRELDAARQAELDLVDDYEINQLNQKKITSRNDAIAIINAQIQDENIYKGTKDTRYDTKEEVNSKIAELEQLLKDAKKGDSENLKYIRDYFSGGALDSSEEARDASTAQINGINKLISKFEAVLKALE